MEHIIKPLCVAFHNTADRFFTPEEIQRCHAVESLHGALSHVSDAALGVALDNGVIVSPLRLTSSDVALNRLYPLNYECPQCAGSPSISNNFQSLHLLADSPIN